MAASEILDPDHWIRAAGPLEADLSLGITDTWARCSGAGFGTPLHTARSSWTRRAESAHGSYFVKVYDYPRWRDRRRGALRNTWLAPSRALREWRALRWLRHHDFLAPEPWGVAERRDRLGFLQRAVLVTAAWPAPPLSALLTALAAADRDALLADLGRWVARLHRAGFRDRNLDPRNILAHREPDGPAAGTWQFAKIDSPRHRLRRPQPAPDDRLTRADRRRLAAGLEALGVRAADRMLGGPGSRGADS